MSPPCANISALPHNPRFFEKSSAKNFHRLRSSLFEKRLWRKTFIGCAANSGFGAALMQAAPAPGSGPWDRGGPPLSHEAEKGRGSGLSAPGAIAPEKPRIAGRASAASGGERLARGLRAPKRATGCKASCRGAAPSPNKIHDRRRAADVDFSSAGLPAI